MHSDEDPAASLAFPVPAVDSVMSAEDFSTGDVWCEPRFSTKDDIWLCAVY